MKKIASLPTKKTAQVGLFAMHFSFLAVEEGFFYAMGKKSCYVAS